MSKQLAHGEIKATKQLGLENSQRDNDLKEVRVHAKQGPFSNLHTIKIIKKNIHQSI